MKALAFNIPKTTQASFRVQVDELPYFYDRLHHHPELQISLILRGYGTQFIGHRVRSFQAGELFVIAANLPHVLKSDPIFYEKEEESVAAISIFFNELSFGQAFFDLPEMQHIANWMRKLQTAVKISGPIKAQIGALLKAMVNQNEFQRFLQLLNILDLLAHAKTQTVIAQPSFTRADKTVDPQEFNLVFQYLMDNYHRRISLQEVAALLNKSSASFCRYFKLHTQKTFVQFLNEIRIGVACQKLQERNQSISEICYQCGFSNLSNFNRQFKKIMQLSPSQYLRKRSL